MAGVGFLQPLLGVPQVLREALLPGRRFLRCPRESLLEAVHLLFEGLDGPLRLLELCPERLASRGVGRRLRRGCRRLGAGQLLYVVRLLLVQFFRRLGHRSFEVSLELYPLGRNRLLHEVTLLLLQVLNLLRPLAEAHLHLHLFLRKVLALLHDFLDDRVLLLEQHRVIPALLVLPLPLVPLLHRLARLALRSSQLIPKFAQRELHLGCGGRLRRCFEQLRLAGVQSLARGRQLTLERGDARGWGVGLGRGWGARFRLGWDRGGRGWSLGGGLLGLLDNILDNLLVRHPSLLRDDLPLGDRRLRVNPTLRVVPRVGSWGRRRGRRGGWFLFLALPARFRHGHGGC
mmetsp:Transcript_11073/g.51298  ORF Transcript_11073/g.51298 Transcript_11073/m.51298 type:complete len:345 (+) Transcript_11073:1881-2915(+)